MSRFPRGIIIKSVGMSRWRFYLGLGDMCLVQSILVQKYGFSSEAASSATQSFLKSFRKCPENPEFQLHDWRHMLWKKCLGESYSEISGEVYSQWLNLRYKYIAPSAEVISLLKCLRKSYWLCVITNGPSNSQWEKITRLRLSQYFDLILVSGDLKWEKPNKNIFLMACNHLGVRPEECVMVGDKLDTDIRGGIEAGLGGTVWVLPVGSSGCGKSVQVTMADCAVEDVTEVKCVLSRAGWGAFHRSHEGGWSERGNAEDLEDGNSNSSDGS